VIWLGSHKALPPGRDSLFQQTVTAVIHRYWHTIIVPAYLSRCVRCYSTQLRPYTVVVEDGQAISTMKNQSEPLSTATIDLSATRMDVNIGCCMPSAAARSAARNHSQVLSGCSFCCTCSWTVFQKNCQINLLLIRWFISRTR